MPVGGLVTPNAAQPLTTIVPLDPIWVRFKVSEAQYLAFKKCGQARRHQAFPCNYCSPITPCFPTPATSTNTLNQVDPRTGTLEMQARIPQSAACLLPGQFGRVRYVAEHRTGAILVPQRAVQQNQSMQIRLSWSAPETRSRRARQDRSARRRCLADRTGSEARRSRDRGRPAYRAARRCCESDALLAPRR